MRKTVAILGSTGSIGQQALEVVDFMPDKFTVTALAANRNINLLADQVRKYRPQVAVVGNPSLAAELRRLTDGIKVDILSGDSGLVSSASLPELNLVLVAVSGVAGVLPTLSALRAGKTVALANKEALVAAGAVIMETSRSYPGRIIPVDSEHGAIYQCLRHTGAEGIKEIWLTASGGPLRNLAAEKLALVTPAMTLDHPNWRMGKKISVDSATMMNKGLEVIEAKWLFGIGLEQIRIVIHPQSIIHSMVCFADGSVIAQMAEPDMRLPIQYALCSGDHYPGPVSCLDLVQTGALTFAEPEWDKFPCLSLALEAGKSGGTYPAVLNAADEEVVQAFIAGAVRFDQIAFIIEQALNEHQPVWNPTLDDIMAVDAETRNWVKNKLS